MIQLLSANRNQDIPVLIGAVDNNASRQLFHQVFNKLDTIIYIDSGNDEITGQVVWDKIQGKYSSSSIG